MSGAIDLIQRRTPVNPESKDPRFVAVATDDATNVKRIETIRAKSDRRAHAAYISQYQRESKDATDLWLDIHDPAFCAFARRWLSGQRTNDAADCTGGALGCLATSGKDVSDQPVRTKPDELPTMKVWKMGYFPFTLGGPVHQPISAEMPSGGPFDLGGGYEGYLVTAPDGDVMVAEASSGGIVDGDLEFVRRDIADGDPEVMARQVADAARQGENARAVPVREFFKT